MQNKKVAILIANIKTANCGHYVAIICCHMYSGTSASGWSIDVPCTASRSSYVDCGQLSTFAAFKPQWQGLGTCRVYTIVCEPPAKPALLVWRKDSNGYKVYKECSYSGGEAMGIIMYSVADDQCNCPVGSLVNRLADFGTANATTTDKTGVEAQAAAGTQLGAPSPALQSGGAPSPK